MPSFMKLMRRDGVFSGGSKDRNRQGWFDVAKWSVNSNIASGGQSIAFLEATVFLKPTDSAFRLAAYLQAASGFAWMTLERYPPEAGVAWYHLKPVEMITYSLNRYPSGDIYAMSFDFRGETYSSGFGAWPGPEK